MDLKNSKQAVCSILNPGSSPVGSPRKPFGHVTNIWIFSIKDTRVDSSDESKLVPEAALGSDVSPVCRIEFNCVGGL
jgi:hypothetical protein